MDVDISLGYALTLLAALLIGLGFVLQQHAAQAEPESRFLSLRLILDLLRTPRWLAGIASMVAGQILAAWSIGNLSLGFVEPLLTTNLVFALILAVPIAKARLRFWEIFGAAVLCVGVALLSASRSAKPIGLSFGSVSHWPAAALIAGIAFVAVQAGRRHPGRTRAMLTGTAAGLIFGIQDALTRQTLEILQSNGVAAMFTTWAPYALVGAGALGIWLMQSAFSVGPLPQSLPAIAAGEPLVGMLLGVLVFGDRIQITPGELALQAAGVAALIVGVIIVGRAPALSQLRAWTPPSLPHVPHVPHVPHSPRNAAVHHGRHAKPTPKTLPKPTSPTPATAPSFIADPATSPAVSAPAAALYLPIEHGATTHPGDTVDPNDTMVPGDTGIPGANGFPGDRVAKSEPGASGGPADTFRPDALALPSRVRPTRRRAAARHPAPPGSCQTPAARPVAARHGLSTRIARLTARSGLTGLGAASMITETPIIAETFYPYRVASFR